MSRQRFAFCPGVAGVVGPDRKDGVPICGVHCSGLRFSFSMHSRHRYTIGALMFASENRDASENCPRAPTHAHNRNNVLSRSEKTYYIEVLDIRWHFYDRDLVCACARRNNLLSIPGVGFLHSSSADQNQTTNTAFDEGDIRSSAQYHAWQTAPLRAGGGYSSVYRYSETAASGCTRTFRSVFCLRQSVVLRHRQR